MSDYLKTVPLRIDNLRGQVTTLAKIASQLKKAGQSNDPNLFEPKDVAASCKPGPGKLPDIPWLSGNHSISISCTDPRYYFEARLTLIADATVRRFNKFKIQQSRSLFSMMMVASKGIRDIKPYIDGLESYLNALSAKGVSGDVLVLHGQVWTICYQAREAHKHYKAKNGKPLSPEFDEFLKFIFQKLDTRSLRIEHDPTLNKHGAMAVFDPLQQRLVFSAKDIIDGRSAAAIAMRNKERNGQTIVIHELFHYFQFTLNVRHGRPLTVADAGTEVDAHLMAAKYYMMLHPSEKTPIPPYYKNNTQESITQNIIKNLSSTPLFQGKGIEYLKAYVVFDKTLRIFHRDRTFELALNKVAKREMKSRRIDRKGRLALARFYAIKAATNDVHDRFFEFLKRYDAFKAKISPALFPKRLPNFPKPRAHFPTHKESESIELYIVKSFLIFLKKWLEDPSQDKKKAKIFLKKQLRPALLKGLLPLYLEFPHVLKHSVRSRGEINQVLSDADEYFKQKNYIDAELSYSIAVSSDPSYKKARQKRGVFFAVRGKWRAAVMDLRVVFKTKTTQERTDILLKAMNGHYVLSQAARTLEQKLGLKLTKLAVVCLDSYVLWGMKRAKQSRAVFQLVAARLVNILQSKQVKLTAPEANLISNYLKQMPKGMSRDVVIRAQLKPLKKLLSKAAQN